METTVDLIREDRYTFRFPEGDGPLVTGGYRDDKQYPARVVFVYARFTPEGELLESRVTAKKLKKDGSLSTVNAYLGYHFDGLDDSIREWRSTTTGREGAP